MDKTFEAIQKLQDVEIELYRLKNALEMMNRASERKIKAEPTIDNWPLYSGLPQPKEDQGLTTNPLPAIKLQEDWALGVGFKKAVPESFAQSAQVIGTQKKEFVGLTKEDLETVHQELLSMSGGSFNTIAKAIENKLKEKNT
jgi:hypothetical protein